MEFPKPTVLTLTGRRIDEGMGIQADGLVLLLITETAKKASSADERKELGNIRALLGQCEASIVHDLFRAGLTNAAFPLESASPPGCLLVLKPHQFGLAEIAHGRFTPALSIQAELRDCQGKILWSALAAAASNSGRTIEDYRDHADLYRQDFTLAASDVVQQLISGPIRPLQQ